MPEGVWPSVIVGMFALLGQLLSRWLASRETAALKAGIAEVHIIVNQQRTEMMAEIKQLKEDRVQQAIVAKTLADAVAKQRTPDPLESGHQATL